MQVIGNIGGTMEQLTPRLTSALLQCVRSAEPSLLIQKAAIQALRKMKNKDEVKSTEEGCEGKLFRWTRIWDKILNLVILWPIFYWFLTANFQQAYGLDCLAVCEHERSS